MASTGILYFYIETPVVANRANRKIIRNVEQYLRDPKHVVTEARVIAAQGCYTVLWIELADDPYTGHYHQEIIIEFDSEDDAWLWVVSNELEHLTHSYPMKP